MIQNDELQTLVQLGLEHYMQTKNKVAAMNVATSRLTSLGYLEDLKSQLAEQFGQYDESKVEEEYDEIMKEGLLDRIGYEPTETKMNLRPTRSGSCQLDAPMPEA